MTTAAAEFDTHRGIGAIVITGSEKAFAAGANIKEMADELSLADFGSGRLEVSGAGACDDERQSITSPSQTRAVPSVWGSDNVSR